MKKNKEGRSKKQSPQKKNRESSVQMSTKPFLKKLEVDTQKNDVFPFFWPEKKRGKYISGMKESPLTQIRKSDPKNKNPSEKNNKI